MWGASLAAAQESSTVEPLNVAATTINSDNPISPELINEIESLILRGNHEEVIRKSTPLLQKSKANEPRLLYLRGRSAYSLGLYNAAQQDFSQIGDFTPYHRWPLASDYIRRIEDLKGLMPKNIREVKNGQNIPFRVYYDRESPWLDALIKLLPQAYAINSKLLNRSIAETPVFVFSDFERFKKFYALNANNTTPSSWAWAAGKSSGVYFCENHPANTASHDFNGIYFQIAAAHEFNHTAVGRIVGGASLPNWFSEGLAMMTSPQINPAVGHSYDTRVRKAKEANAILSMQDISRRESFRDSVESQNGSDAYAQGYSMTYYLLSVLTPEKLTPFLEEVRESRRFDVALFKFTGLSPSAFYDAWLAELNG
jgi:hypothetical protein